MYLINTNQIQIMQIRERETDLRCKLQVNGSIYFGKFFQENEQTKTFPEKKVVKELQKPKLLFSLSLSLSLSDTSHTTQTQRQTITFEKVREKCYLRSKYNTFLSSEKYQIIHVEINYIIKRK